MKRLIPLLFLGLPLALFAQAPKTQETTMLKGFGLNDSQIAQVFDIQDKTRATMRQDTVQLRLLHAQMEKALLPVTPNMQDVNGYITQMAQTRTDLMKAFVGARVQIRQIIGDDNFPAYTRFIMRSYRGGGGHMGMFRGGPGGAGAPMGQDRPMMGGPRANDDLSE
jgi:hypothetical protein